MLESMQDLLAQHRQLVAAAMIPIDPPTQPVVFKKPAKPPRRLNKKDISAPCNFKHVSGENECVAVSVSLRALPQVSQ